MTSIFATKDNVLMKTVNEMLKKKSVLKISKNTSPDHKIWLKLV